MQIPEIRIVQPQEVITTNDVKISSSEVNSLLAKYNLTNNVCVTPIQSNDLTFEEMVENEKTKLKAAESKRLEELNRPRAVTFNDKNVNYHNTNFQSLKDGFGIQVQVVTDMNIDNGYNSKYYK